MAKNADSGFEIVISGDGVKISQTVSPEVGRQIIALTMGAVPPSPVSARRAELPQLDHLKSGNSGVRTSLREFLDGTGATRYPEKMTAIGQYLIDHESAEDFSKDDIQSRFRSAGEAPPRNFHRDFSWAVTNGWLAEDTKKPNAYYVTQKGRTAIQNKFSAEIRKATRLARRKAKKKVVKG